MNSPRPYHEQVDILNTVKLRELISTLPEFVRLFFRGIEPTTSSRTRIAYAYDLHVFFEFLCKEKEEFSSFAVPQITLGMLDQVRAVDLEN